ncbi:hypothetical protein [Winogradskyella schleiferi]|uniref:hypothetical protein n=1 Tax=Winogradskyella schleiferi TaxID=2686078 RepID=UPI0015BE1322|nr:hypothetical protein [Winogradskyella schleiferi]
MNYSEELKKVAESNAFIGKGNPNSDILIVGKEVATNAESSNSIEEQNTISFENNASDWIKNIQKNVKQEDINPWIFNENLELENVDNNPLFAFKGSIKKHTSDTWKKYQKLYDLIFKGQIEKNNEIELDFQKGFFITEMSEIPSKTTNSAQKKVNFKNRLQNRKNTFFKSVFIQNFPVVVLACSDYIVNNDKIRDIDNIFNVEFTEEKGTEKLKFWVHKNKSGKPKLVIHTRQLSNAVEDNLLLKIAEEIKEFVK